MLFMRESEGETQGRGRRATGIETDRVVHLDVTYREKRAQAAPGVGYASLASATTLAILELPATPSRLSKRASQKCRTLHVSFREASFSSLLFGEHSERRLIGITNTCFPPLSFSLSLTNPLSFFTYSHLLVCRSSYGHNSDPAKLLYR